MITQKQIDHISHDKRYYLVLPQFRNAVKGETEERGGYVPWRGLAVLGVITAGLSLLLVWGWFDWMVR